MKDDIRYSELLFLEDVVKSAFAYPCRLVRSFAGQSLGDFRAWAGVPRRMGGWVRWGLWKGEEFPILGFTLVSQ